MPLFSTEPVFSVGISLAITVQRCSIIHKELPLLLQILSLMIKETRKKGWKHKKEIAWCFVLQFFKVGCLVWFGLRPKIILFVLNSIFISMASIFPSLHNFKVTDLKMNYKTRKYTGRNTKEKEAAGEQNIRPDIKSRSNLGVFFLFQKSFLLC